MTSQCRTRRDEWPLSLLLVSVALIVSCSPSKSQRPSSEEAPAGTAPSLVARDLGSGRCVAVNTQGLVLGVDVDDTTFVITPGRRRSVLSPSGAKELVNGKRSGVGLREVERAFCGGERVGTDGGAVATACGAGSGFAPVQQRHRDAALAPARAIGVLDLGGTHPVPRLVDAGLHGTADTLLHGAQRAE